MSEEFDSNDTRGPPPSSDRWQPGLATAQSASDTGPFILTDTIATSDAGHLLMVQYVDIGASSEDWEHAIPVKGIEAEYSLAHSHTIRISCPHRFQPIFNIVVRNALISNG